MKELVEYIAQALVDDLSQVDVRVQQVGKGVRIELSVGKDDMGRVIGKGGRVANAMRLLLRVAAAREGKQVMLHIVEPE